MIVTPPEKTLPGEFLHATFYQGTCDGSEFRFSPPLCPTAWAITSDSIIGMPTEIGHLYALHLDLCQSVQIHLQCKLLAQIQL